MVTTIIFKYICVSVLISLIFGATVFLSSIIKKEFKNDYIIPYLFQLWSLLLFIIIWIYLKPNISIFSTLNLLSLKNLLLIIMTIIPTSIIAYQGRKMKPRKTFIFRDFLNGASMEIPQRLLVQNLFIILGANHVVFYSLSLDILLNAIIWVEFILVQEVIQGKKITSAILPEVIASFWFSIWVGILYKDTGNIIIPMLVHGLQRILTNKIYERFGKRYTSGSNKVDL